MEKPALRKKYKSKRAALSLEEREEASLAIANRLLELDIWNKDYYHIFLPIERLQEVNTEYILNILSGKDKHILISKSNFETNTMQNYLLLDNTKLLVNSYGIPEPVDGIKVPFENVDVVFLPLLAYDTTGNRVGYGKGFYDKFLGQCKPDVLTIGLSFFEPEKGNISTNDTDIPMKYCISPKNTWKFS